jgi:hypothetical protein
MIIGKALLCPDLRVLYFNLNNFVLFGLLLVFLTAGKKIRRSSRLQDLELGLII